MDRQCIASQYNRYETGGPLSSVQSSNIPRSLHKETHYEYTALFFQN